MSGGALGVQPKAGHAAPARFPSALWSAVKPTEPARSRSGGLSRTCRAAAGLTTRSGPRHASMSPNGGRRQRHAHVSGTAAHLFVLPANRFGRGRPGRRGQRLARNRRLAGGFEFRQTLRCNGGARKASPAARRASAHPLSAGGARGSVVVTRRPNVFERQPPGGGGVGYARVIWRHESNIAFNVNLSATDPAVSFHSYDGRSFENVENNNGRGWRRGK